MSITIGFLEVYGLRKVSKHILSWQFSVVTPKDDEL